jgi:hypothetical protein
MKIAKADRDAMNALYAQVLKRKKATPVDSIVSEQAKADHAEMQSNEEAVLSEDRREMKMVAAKNEGNNTEQAFKDHEEYMSTLEDVLKEDEKEGWDPNDPKLD